MKNTGSAAFGLKLLMGGVSLVALTAMAVAAPSAMAQETTTDGADEVVVTGVRKSLKSAQQIKKDADTIVDSITANDIGSFPDKSVAEALQRVAGISVNRFAASDDTAHFSAEPSGVVVRGLQQVRSEFNGRDIFSADSNRGLSWSDVSPELMGGVDVYKNQTAELIEGGIAGTVNLKTRLPFDQKGRLLAVSADYTWGDLAKKGTPSVSGIFSQRWDTEIGEFGFLINAAHSQTYTNSQGFKLGRYGAVVHSNFGGSGDVVWDNPTKKYLPTSVMLGDSFYDRVRDGVSVAGQWKNNDGSMVATLQYNRSKKHETMEERVLTANSGIDTWAQPLDYVSPNAQGVICVTTCQFNDEGGLISGTLGTDINVWMTGFPNNAGASDTGSELTCYSWTCSDDDSTVRGTRYAATSRWSDSVNDTSDIGFNFKWKVSDKLTLNFDVQSVNAIQTNYDIDATMKTFATVGYDFSGDDPKITISDPLGFNDVQDAPGSTDDDLPPSVNNPLNYAPAHIMDHVTDSDGKMTAVRLDAAYSFDSPWLNTLKFGVRVADREQTVRWSTYNWKVTIRDWEAYDRDNYYVTGPVFPAGSYEAASLGDNWMGGDAINNPGGVFYSMDLIKDQQRLAETFGNQSYQPHNTGGGATTNEWVPICYRPDELANSCFKAAELSQVQEKTNAAFVQLKFGGNDATIFNGVTVTGNVGVRYVETQNISTGGVNYPNPDPSTYGTVPYEDQEVPPAGSGIIVRVYDYTYFIPQEDREFVKASTQLATASITHKHWLPSFNVRFGLTDQWFLRFAASRAMSRPDIGNLKAYSSVARANPPGSMSLETACSEWFECTAGVPTKAKVKYTGQAQNPYLKPVTADQVDLSVENYFSSTGSVTFNLFYKKFHDYIQYGNYYRNFTNNGVTREVLMSGPMNGDGASIKGFEIAYQSFFDFLPAPFDGLGIQANYTHLKNSGITGAAVKKETADDNGSADPIIGGVTRSANSFTKLPLEQLSDNSYNLIGMYEKGQFSARVAYNWRSKFMVTAQDCCTVFPVFQKDAGYLDARFAYRVNEAIELSLEGSNLLNTQTVLMQMVDGSMTAYPDREAKFVTSSWLQNDRRLTASVRLKY